MIWWLATAWAGVCGMPEPASMQPLAMPPVVHRMDGDLLERDAFNPAFPHLRTSEHFAPKWGRTRSSTRTQPRTSWMRSSSPGRCSSTSWAMRCCVRDLPVERLRGQLGDGAPSIKPHQFGYYTTDPDGMPMIVVRPGLATSGEDAVQALMAHELYHVMQDASLRMDGQDVRWFWEATAVWSETVVFPDNLDHVRQGYVQRPYVPLASHTDLATDADRAQTSTMPTCCRCTWQITTASRSSPTPGNKTWMQTPSRRFARAWRAERSTSTPRSSTTRRRRPCSMAPTATPCAAQRRAPG